MVVGVGGAGGTALGSEVCAALLLLCWLCCWPDDANSDSSPSEYSRNPVLVVSGSRRRSGALLGRRAASSAVSLHLPGTSGFAKQPLAAHRSHEEIRGRRKSHHEPSGSDTRYHSAPSVIDEVLHRRDWERSTKDLYIPLNPENECLKCGSTPSLKAPYAEPETSSIEGLKPETSSIEGLKPEDPQNSHKNCKKHHTNIKSSKGKKCKESNKDDIKDTDATEMSPETSNFYIGDHHEESIHTKATTSDQDEFIENERLTEERNRSIYKAKDAKQSFNESIRLKELPRKSLVPLAEGEVRSFGFYPVDNMDDDEDIDRSGAQHHTIESRISLRPFPPPSVETVGYDGGACYLPGPGPLGPVAMGPVATGLRARHASDGDMLAPPLRPESGAFSESDLDLELEESEERPPHYDDLPLYASPKKETAI